LLEARQEVPVSDQQDVPIPGELRVAMEEFSDALRAPDVARALASFSSAQGFRYADTRPKTPAVQAIAFKRLQRELDAKSGLYLTLFDPSGLVQYMTGKHARPWFATSASEFAPRDLELKNVWVRWRLEGDSWVVDTIGFPAAIAGTRSPR
jgi:hypothetical protein